MIKKLLTPLLILAGLAMPIAALANFPASWNATSTTGTIITPSVINNNEQVIQARSLIATSSTDTSKFAGTVQLTPLATPAGSIIAVDKSGNIIATTTSSGGVASVSGTAPIFSSGGTNPTISFAGLATSTNGVISNILYYSGLGTVANVSTSTLTASSPLTGSFTVIGSGGSVGCQIASGSQAGCLSSGDWTTFNNKGSGSVTSIATTWPITGGTITTSGTLAFAGLGTTSPFTTGQLTYVTNSNTITSVATSSASCSSGVSCSSFTVVGSVSPSITNSGVTQITAGNGISLIGSTGNVTVGQTSYVATGTAETAGQIPYWGTTSGTPAKLLSIATTTASCAGTASCTSFTIIGSSPVTITGSGSGGSGNVSTSTVPTIGNLAYWTTSGATPELLGKVGTSSASCSGFITCSGFTVVGGVSPTITQTGVLGIANGGTNSATQTLGNVWYNGTGIVSTSSAFTVGSLIGTTTATSTLAGGITATCFSTGTGCITGSGGSGTVNSSTLGYNAFYNSTGTAVSGTSTIFTNTKSFVGIGTTTPAQQLTVTGQGLFQASTTDNANEFTVQNKAGSSTVNVSTIDSTADIFDVASSTGTNYFNVGSGGNVGIGTSSPFGTLSVTGNIQQYGGYAHFGTQPPIPAAHCLGDSCIELWGNDNSVNGVVMTVANNSNGASAYDGYQLYNDQPSNAINVNYAGMFFQSSKYNDNTFGTANNVANLMALTNTEGPISIQAASSTNSAAYIAFVTGGTDNSNERARITSVGNFGIGTTSPWSMLSVKGASDLGNSALAGFFTGTTTATSTLTGGLAANILNTTSTTASSTFSNGVNLTRGCFAINGSCVGGSGGSGTVNSGTQGQVTYYAANGTTVSGTSTIFIATNTNVGIGSSTPYTNFSVTGTAAATNLIAVSRTATTTLYGGFVANNAQIVSDLSTGTTTLNQFQLGPINFQTDGGVVTALDMPLTAASAATTPESYTFNLDGSSTITVYGTADGAGNLQTAPNVGIASTTPWRTLDINGTVGIKGITTSSGLQTAVLCQSSKNEMIADSVACLASARRYKTDINPLDVGLDEVMQLQPVSFYWKKDFNGQFQSDPNKNGIQYSLIADDVQKVDKNLVSVTTGTTTFEGKTYLPGAVEGLADVNHWVALFVASFHDMENQIQSILADITGLKAQMQTQQQEIDTLQAQINKLK